MRHLLASLPVLVVRKDGTHQLVDLLFAVLALQVVFSQVSGHLRALHVRWALTFQALGRVHA